MPNIKYESLIVQHIRQRLKFVRVQNINYPSLTIAKNAKMKTFLKILIDRQCLSIDQNCLDTQLVEPIDIIFSINTITLFSKNTITFLISQLFQSDFVPSTDLLKLIFLMK